MNEWHQFWARFFFMLSSILPWFAAPTIGIVIISVTPLGRALTRFLKDFRRSVELPADVLNELTLTRQEVAEVLERLEFLERVAQQRQLQPPSERPRGDKSRATTPV